MEQVDEARSEDHRDLEALPVLDLFKPHDFIKPVKKINEGQDVQRFLASRAYVDICKFVMQLNISMCPRQLNINGSKQVKTWELENPDITSLGAIKKIQDLLAKINEITDEVPPGTGPRRFGNISFRKWYELLESRVSDLLEDFLPADILHTGSGREVIAKDELTAYLLGGFGSAQRLDYGTGHELSFLAFLGCLWKLHTFEVANKTTSEISRSIVLGIVEPYLRLIRRLILTYTLEPAGSHGVWGLDDHSFLPYIFGSAQFCPPIHENNAMPIEGSFPGAPDPGDVAKMNVVERERKTNMYFAAVGFIYDVKTGPFWEHSPMLFDISGIRYGWGKINKGMIKMYNAEVLCKFPVVQHFPFGSLFSWGEDPNAPPLAASAHLLNQPQTHSGAAPGSFGAIHPARPLPQDGIRAPWAQPISKSDSRGKDPTNRPLIAETSRAPWAGSGPTTATSGQTSTSRPFLPQEGTKAPWAR